MPATPIDWSKLPATVEGVRNDASIPAEAVLAKLKAGGVEIVYGDLMFLVEKRVLDSVRADVATLEPERRRHMMQSVDRALRKYKAKVLKGTASKKRMDAFHNDLLLWTALREVSEA